MPLTPPRPSMSITAPRRQAGHISRGLRGQVLKIRWIKPYADAHNHILVGQVLEDSPAWLKLVGRTIHYKNSFTTFKQGPVGIRYVPWHRIEVIHELPSQCNWRDHLVIDDNGNLVLKKTGQVMFRRGTEI